jgi:hypothetical protein
METCTARRPTVVWIVAAGLAGLALGSYGIANAAGGSGSSGGAANAASTAASTTPAAPGARHGWGGQRPDETALTGDTASKVRSAALAKAPSGATVERLETDADGHAKYEAHLVTASGGRLAVYVNEQFQVVGGEER